MSFSFEDIKDESFLKMAEHCDGKHSISVIPKSMPPNFPLTDQKLQGCCMSLRYKNMAEKIKSFEVYDDDVWLVTYPRSGTTWCQEMICLLKNSLDYEKFSKIKMNDRFPFLELDAIRDMPPGMSFLDKIKNFPRPRLIKTHLPIQLLPDQIWTVNPKIVYVFRQPKDVAVSYFHQYRTLNNYQGGIKEFVDCFVQELLFWSPFHEHISGFLELSEKQKNVHLVKYEDMKSDLGYEILKMSKFLETSIEDEQILELVDHLSIDNMKKNPAVNMETELSSMKQVDSNKQDKNLVFIRKGEVGGWKNELSTQLSKQIDDWSDNKINNNKYLQKYLLSSTQQ